MRRENVELPLKIAGMDKAKRTPFIDDVLETVGLDHVPRSQPWQLSGGMQQRMAIFRAVAYQLEVLLMDESCGVVDAQNRAYIECLLRRLWKQLGVTVLFVTHYIDQSVYLGECAVIVTSSPAVMQHNIKIDLPDERDQLVTRSSARFAELRHHVYGLIQLAEQGSHPDAAIDQV